MTKCGKGEGFVNSGVDLKSDYTLSLFASSRTVKVCTHMASIVLVRICQCLQIISCATCFKYFCQKKTVKRA